MFDFCNYMHFKRETMHNYAKKLIQPLIIATGKRRVITFSRSVSLAMSLSMSLYLCIKEGWFQPLYNCHNMVVK